jgi:integrase
MKTTGKGYLFQRFKDKNGDPCGNYYLQYDLNGERKLISLKTANEVLAKKRRNEILDPALLATSKEKVIVHIAEARKLITTAKYPLDAVWMQFKKSVKRPDSSAGTLGNYERNWNIFKGWLKAKYPAIEKINQITKREAELYAGHLWSGGMAAATFNYHVFSLKLIFKKLCGGAENPFAEIQRKTEIKAERKHFEKADVLRILAAVDGADSAFAMQRGDDNKFLKRDTLYLCNKDEMRVLFYLGAWTGARLADCAMMKRESINLAGNNITFKPIKTRRIQREVTIPLHPDLRRVLVDYMNGGKGEYLLPNVAERYQRNKDGIINDIIKVLEHCGFQTRVEVKDRGQRLQKAVQYGFHSFRHSFATFVANAGVPIVTLAAILGDNIATLQKYYVKINDESKNKAIAALPIGSGEPTPSGAAIDTTAETWADMAERVWKAVTLLKSGKPTKAAWAELLSILEG